MPVRAPVAPFRSIDDVISLAKARAASLVLLLVCCAGLAQPDVAFADWPALRVSAAQLEYGDLRFKEVRAALTEDRAFEVSFDAMQGSGESLLGDGLTLNGIVRDAVLDRDALQLSGGLEAWGLTAELTLERSAGNLEAQLVTANQPVTLLADLGGLPPEIGWVRDGVFEAVLRWRQTHEQPPELTFSLAADGLSFDSPDGQFAGELLRLTARGSAAGDALSGLRVDGAIERGELLVKDFYRDFGEAELGFGAHLRWTEAALEVADLSLRDDTALSVAGSAMLGLGPHSDEWSLRVDHLGLRFPGAYRRYLEPLAAAWTLDGLELTGSLRWAGEWSSMGLTSGNLDIVDLSVVDTRRGRFALTGLETQLRPGDYRFDSRLSWRGLIFGRINLGAGQATLDSEPGAVALLEPLPLDVLGGRLELQRLKVVLPGRANPARDEPDIQLQARLDGVDMEQLTAALGWPSFTGKLSGEIPGVALSDGVLEVEGEIRVRVFDGLVMLQNLRMERPFGVLPSLAADVEVTNLDLDQLTHTFSFGHISGRLDGYVRELRMLDWTERRERHLAAGGQSPDDHRRRSGYDRPDQPAAADVHQFFLPPPRAGLSSCRLRLRIARPQRRPGQCLDPRRRRHSEDHDPGFQSAGRLAADGRQPAGDLVRPGHSDRGRSGDLNRLSRHYASAWFGRMGRPTGNALSTARRQPGDMSTGTRYEETLPSPDRDRSVRPGGLRDHQRLFPGRGG
jgi:hypothetical protein